ncbi:MAG: bifunctional glycosyltransferase family 2/GtrA family protein [Clostridia bacterium]|nr:bifunctional glycosyltransferase family 2/GtrA family protein [Clostridia bacterium]
MIVVIPAYEPDEKLIGLVENIHNNTEYSIVIVNDGSRREGCREVFEAVAKYADVVHHEVNKGKGRALKTAYEHIKNSANYPEHDHIVTVDADGQHLIEDIIKIGEASKENNDALIIGGRKFKGNVPLKSRLGNGITRFVFAFSTGVRVYDTQTGLRAFSTDHIDEMLAIGGERYEYEINQLLYCTKKHIKIIELEIATVYINDNETSHFHPVRDSFRIYKTIFAFVGSSLFCFLLDYLLLLLLTYFFVKITGGAGFTLFERVIEPKLIALIIARAVSSTVNYLLNKTLVFDSKSKGSVYRYFATVIFILIVNYLVLLVFDKAGIPLAIGQILAQLIIYPLNYLIQQRFVFKEN